MKLWILVDCQKCVRVNLLPQQIFEARVQFDVVFTQVAEELVRPQDLGDSH